MNYQYLLTCNENDNKIKSSCFSYIYIYIVKYSIDLTKNLKNEYLFFSTIFIFLLEGF